MGVKGCQVAACTSTNTLCGKEAKVLQLIFTVISGEVLHISSAPTYGFARAYVRKNVFFCRTVHVFSEACMVSGLAAVKQWRDGEGALLLSDGLRQTVTQQP